MAKYCMALDIDGNRKRSYGGNRREVLRELDCLLSTTNRYDYSIFVKLPYEKHSIRIRFTKKTSAKVKRGFELKGILQHNKIQVTAINKILSVPINYK